LSTTVSSPVYATLLDWAASTIGLFGVGFDIVDLNVLDRILGAEPECPSKSRTLR